MVEYFREQRYLGRGSSEKGYGQIRAMEATRSSSIDNPLWEPTRNKTGIWANFYTQEVFKKQNLNQLLTSSPQKNLKPPVQVGRPNGHPTRIRTGPGQILAGKMPEPERYPDILPEPVGSSRSRPTRTYLEN